MRREGKGKGEIGKEWHGKGRYWEGQDGMGRRGEKIGSEGRDVEKNNVICVTYSNLTARAKELLHYMEQITEISVIGKPRTPQQDRPTPRVISNLKLVVMSLIVHHIFLHRIDP